MGKKPTHSSYTGGTKKGMESRGKKVNDFPGGFSNPSLEAQVPSQRADWVISLC